MKICNRCKKRSGELIFKDGEYWCGGCNADKKLREAYGQGETYVTGIMIDAQELKRAMEAN